MNIRTWINTVGTAAVLSISLAALPAQAGGYAYTRHVDSHARYDYARVLSAEPIIRYVTVTTPVRECWEETRYYTVENEPRGAGVQTLFGAVIGGIVGHQFGGGRGKDAATVAGSLIGASIASDAARARSPYTTTEYARPVTQCEMRQQTHEEERIDGYHVVYSYNGQKYATRMPNDPGNRVRIRVDVRPAP